MMNQDYSDEFGFVLSEIKMSCCGVKSTLNDLHYKFPMGFSRFMLTIDDSCKDIQSLIVELSAILGCTMRVIYKMC